MKKFILIFFFLSVKGFASPITFIGGLPDQSLDFVSNILEMKFNFVSDLNAEVDSTTAIYSIFSKHEVQRVSQVVALTANGISNETLWNALDKAVEFSPVVLSMGVSDTVEQCGLMLMHPYTVFILPAGDDASEISLIAPSCEARNILRVAAINEARDHLATFSNYGLQTVYIAAKGQNVSVKIRGGLETRFSGTAFAAASVAAELSKFAEKNMDILLFSGASALVEAFFWEKTELLSSVSDRIRDGRILKSSLDL